MNLYETFEKPDMLDSPKEFPLSETAYITLLPTSGEKAKRAFQRMMEPYTPRIKAGGSLTEAEIKDLNVRHFAETIIVGWRGLKGKNGEEVVFSRDNAKMLLSDTKLEEFFNLIAKMAQNDAAFAEEVAQADEGNS